jgi:DNA-binding NtrC family response regulator
MMALKLPNWPGNVRELQNRVKQGVVLADSPLIGPKELDLVRASGDRGYTKATLKEVRMNWYVMDRRHTSGEWRKWIQNLRCDGNQPTDSLRFDEAI